MHLIIDGFVQDSTKIVGLKDWLELMPIQIGMTRIAPAIVEHNAVITAGIVILAESHISVHIAHESGRAFIDLFSCKEFEYRVVLNRLNDIGLKHFYTGVKVIARGLEYLA